MTEIVLSAINQQRLDRRLSSLEQAENSSPTVHQTEIERESNGPSNEKMLNASFPNSTRSGLGDGVLANPLFAKEWEAKARPPNQVGASGHYFVWKNQTYRIDSLPKGAQVTLYLDRKEDRTLELVLSNGLQYRE